MAELFLEPGAVHYVEVDEKLCNGCVLCMKACPTKAIRVKNGLACVEGICIDCVECVRVCPRGAMKALSAERVDLIDSGKYVVSPSTVLYSQFGEDVLPNDVLLGLRRMGFRYVHDQSYTSELYSFATELYIREMRKKPDAPFPVISTVCPVVLRLIEHRFPSLLNHISPLATVREIVAREAKKRISLKDGIPPEAVKVLHITPCPAMKVQITAPFFEDPSYSERAMGINRIYEALEKNIREVEDDRVLHYSSGVGLSWGISGGELAGLNRNGIAVSGLHETIRYLEKVEMGLLKDIDFLECRVCREGCIGGPSTVADRYQTKNLVQRFIRMFGVERRIKYKYVIKLYKAGWFFRGKDRVISEATSTQLSISERIEWQKRVEDIHRSLPGKECGVCGAPDCRTFAEDVADKRAGLEDCVYLRPNQN
jgi:Na+-translocating ferredoxin:NAD+ oxidoreductase RNF subunit RnfB